MCSPIAQSRFFFARAGHSSFCSAFSAHLTYSLFTYVIVSFGWSKSNFLDSDIIGTSFSSCECFRCLRQELLFSHPPCSPSCWKLLIPKAIPCIPRLISVVPLVSLLLVGLQSRSGQMCFALFLLSKTLLAQVDGVFFSLVFCLHRRELEVLVFSLQATASMTLTNPFQVHRGGTKDPLFHFFY